LIFENKNQTKNHIMRNRNAIQLAKGGSQLQAGIKKNVVANPQLRRSVGPTANASVETTLKTIVLNFDSASAARTCIVGDPDNLIANAFGADALVASTFNNPSSIAGSNVTTWKNSLASNPVTVQAIKLRVSTGDAAQFDNNFILATADHNGSRSSVPLIPALYRQNNQQIAEILDLNLDPSSFFTLDAFKAMYFNLNADTSLSMVLSLAYTAGRA
jgi:hypothetical protein